LFEMASGAISWEQFAAHAGTATGGYGIHLRALEERLALDSILQRAFRLVVRSKTPVKLETFLGFRLCSLGLVQWTDDNDVRISCELYRQYFTNRFSV
jgi:hypothetical protein